MGWFDEQIKLRKNNDNKAYRRSIIEIAGAVTGKKPADYDMDEVERQDISLGEILKFYNAPAREIPARIKSFEDRMEYLLHPTGIMYRKVALETGWSGNAYGAMLGFFKEGHTPVALLPNGLFRYKYYDIQTGEYTAITKNNEDLFEKNAFVFYRPFPLKELSLVDLAKYIASTIELWDYIMIALAALAVTLVGMLMPRINFFLFDTVTKDGNLSLMLSTGLFLFCASTGSLMLGMARSMVSSRIDTKMSICVEAATMMRLLSLPAGFFKDYGAGELSSRASCVNSLCTTIINVALNTGLTSVFSLVYISQIFVYAPALVVPALGIIFTTLTFSVVSSLMQMHLTKKHMLLGSKESGMSYAMISGIVKIKLSGAKKRMFARWGSMYAKVAALAYNPPLFLKVNSAIGSAIAITGTIILYNAAIKAQVKPAEYYAFNAAYGMVSGAFMSLLGVALSAANIRPSLEMAKPLLKTAPEVSHNKEILTGISGGFEINNLTFRYDENTPYVLDDISMKVTPGSYVAIVGRTGCGKSTLVRLLLGFEKPDKGGIYYDGRDINTVDLKSLRKNIGVVTQNGKLFAGDIFSNIVIAAPFLGLDDAWEAARIAGIDKDIMEMPMGMNTLISEGAGGISGGQKQRLMIARAVAPKPKLLIFDEATSALDNITQKKVADALNEMKCTRIVIAHRLSTIRQCDRILVLDDGHIVEDGTYEELIDKKGMFFDLVERQRVDES